MTESESPPYDITDPLLPYDLSGQAAKQWEERQLDYIVSCIRKAFAYLLGKPVGTAIRVAVPCAWLAGNRLLILGRDMCWPLTREIATRNDRYSMTDGEPHWVFDAMRIKTN